MLCSDAIVLACYELHALHSLHSNIYCYICQKHTKYHFVHFRSLTQGNIPQILSLALTRDESMHETYTTSRLSFYRKTPHAVKFYHG